jgi:hypothetical protein
MAEKYKIGDFVIFIKDYYIKLYYEAAVKDEWPKIGHIYHVSYVHTTRLFVLNSYRRTHGNWCNDDVLKATKIVARFYGRKL